MKALSDEAKSPRLPIAQKIWVGDEDGNRLRVLPLVPVDSRVQ